MNMHNLFKLRLNYISYVVISQFVLSKRERQGYFLQKPVTA